MNKIAIVCDSSVSFTKDEVEAFGVYIAPLTITHNGKAYVDQVTITQDEVNDLLREHQIITTSQPNIGTMIDILTEIKAKDYDHVFILSIGTALSGSYSAFQHAVSDVEMDNVTVINTYSITGPVQQGVRAIRAMNEQGDSIDTIREYLEYIFDNQVSYVYPETLDQVVMSGRMSRSAQKIASLLRVKPILYLENKGEAIEKLGIARTDKKIFQLLVDDFIKNNVTPLTHDLYLLESEGMATVEAFRDYLFAKMGAFQNYVINLPAAVATHAGLGTIAVQWCPKLKR
ncbi:DegV family protein [Erysipelothrix sp. HDW6C]|uniref:DegV family protein n=1 Tax=Erysipelothrix sp. HDW6C TaxID=2714930 RepID=UPI00140BADA1|nr:DegV family protein [Erysipelothrix sp. HDW6C]QIK69586.1 DegV family protein [Erysipelothrix sp. HDW6C]